MEPLKRIQLNDDGSLQPTLKGGVQAFQDAVDTSQNNIDALSDTDWQGFTKGAAQVPQDFFNVIAHPVKTAEETYNYYKENPLRTIPAYAEQERIKDMTLNMLTNPQEAIPQYGGNLVGQGLTLAALGGLGKGGLKQTSRVQLPIKGSLGGDTLSVKAYNKPLSFQAELLSKGSGIPLSEVRTQLARRIKRNSSLPQGKLGGYNQLTGDINIAPYSETIKYGRTPLDTATHEGWHYTMKRLDALNNAGLTTPEMSKMLYDLRQSQSNKLTPLGENEALSRAIESARNPNIKYNNQTLENIMVNPSDIKAGYDIISPLYREYLGR